MYAKNSARSRCCIGVAAEEYLADLAVRGFRPRSVDTYRDGLRSFAAFLAGGDHLRAQDLTAADIEAYRLVLSSRSLAPATRSLYLRTVRQFCAWLESTRRVFRNPAAGLVIPHPPKALPSVPSENEVARLLAQPDPGTDWGLRDRALLETAYSTGVRREELCRLSVADVDLEHETLRVMGKGRRERVVPLGRMARYWLERYLVEVRPRLLDDAECPALWLNHQGRPLAYDAFIRILHRYVRLAQLTPPISLHSLRRACATHMLQHGAHPAHLQLLLGHAGLRHLSQYLRLSITELRATHARSRPGR